MQKLLVMNKYPMDLLPGEAKSVDGHALSYYQYLNNSRLRAQTGKNIQCVMWCLEGTSKGLNIEEPFGGVGVFSIALQNILKPYWHNIIELDYECYKQLEHTLQKYDVSIVNGDSHFEMATVESDIYVIDFPYFGLMRYINGEWKEELQRVFDNNPQKVVITDGCKFNYHFNWKVYNKKFSNNIISNPESYIYYISKLFFQDYGYSITKCAYHGACFYYMLEPREQKDIEFKYFGSGTGDNGLKLLDGNTLEKHI